MMLASILSALGIGGLGLAVAFVPGFGLRLLKMLKAGFDIIAAYPWQVACGVLALLSVWCWLGWGADNRTNAARIEVLSAWRDEVLSAAREAAHQPKLAAKDVPVQIRALGTALDQIEVAEAEALAKATAAKKAQEDEQERKRKDHDNALPINLAEDRRRAQPWIDGHRLPDDDAAAPRNPGNNGGTGLPSPTFGAEKPDRSDPRSDLVAVPAAFIDACIVNTGRLKNAAEWAAETLPPPPVP